LRHRLAYTWVVIATLALLLGPSTAVFAVLNATAVRPLPFADGSRLVQVFTFPPHVTDEGSRNPLGALDFLRLRQHTTLAVEFAGQWARERALGGTDADPESIPTSAVSANFFRTLGAAPLRGRTFTDVDDRTDAKVAVISFALWHRRFGASEAVLGQHITIDREDYVIVGVMGPAFNALYVPADLWTPLAISEGHLFLPAATFVQTIARLKPGVPAGQLRAELNQLMVDVGKEAPQTRGGWTVKVESVREAQFGASRPALLVLLVAVATLALMAMANLANLTIAEAASRRGEFALRTALGAGRATLLRSAAVENVLLALGGGAAGIALSRWSLPAILALDPATAKQLGAVPLDWRVDAATVCLALIVALASGLGPVFAVTRGNLARHLADTARRTAGSRRASQIRSLLVAAETLLAVVLLSVGALLLTAFDRASRLDPGFDPHQVLGGQLRLSALAYPSPDSRTHLVASVLDRLRATPGIADASVTQNLFIPGFAFVTAIRIDGKPSPDGQPYTVQFRRAMPRYFATMKIPEIDGRTFDDHDGPQALPVAVVSRLFADKFWPGERAVGKRIIRPADVAHPLTVIGVVGDVNDAGLGQAKAATMYTTYAQGNVATASVGLVIRTAGDPLAMASTVTGVVHQIDPAQPFSGVTTMDRFLDDSLGPDRFRGVLLIVFASTGLLIAAVGIYGVASRGVAERTRELGVRMALGGQPSDMRALVLRRAAAGIGIGFIAGVPVAWLAGLAIRHWLPDVGGAAPGTLAVAWGALGAAGALAATVPAMRAGRVDPLVALRAD